MGTRLAGCGGTIFLVVCCILGLNGYGSGKTFVKNIPMGLHLLRGIYKETDKTISRRDNGVKIMNHIMHDKQADGPVTRTKWSSCKAVSSQRSCGPGHKTRRHCTPKGCTLQHRPCQILCGKKTRKSNNLYFSSSSDSSSPVSFHLYTKSVTNVKYKLSNASLIPTDVLKGTVRIVVHGWEGNGSSWYIKEMVPELLKNKQDPTSAIFVVDWKSLADDPLFFFACKQTTKVGKILAKFIRILEKHGASRSRLHLIGFSLGGKVVSAAGTALTKPKIMRISGIDTPTGCFFFSCGSNLNKNDAQFVDSLHNTLISGYHPQGHVNFYPNGPKNCSSQIIHPAHLIRKVTEAHEMAVKYYILSINQCTFKARACKSWYKFPAECYKEYNRMGYHAKPSRTTHTNFYLEAAVKAPFCPK